MNRHTKRNTARLAILVAVVLLMMLGVALFSNDSSLSSVRQEAIDRTIVHGLGELRPSAESSPLAQSNIVFQAMPDLTEAPEGFRADERDFITAWNAFPDVTRPVYDAWFGHSDDAEAWPDLLRDVTRTPREDLDAETIARCREFLNLNAQYVAIYRDLSDLGEAVSPLRADVIRAMEAESGKGHFFVKDLVLADALFELNHGDPARGLEGLHSLLDMAHILGQVPSFFPQANRRTMINKISEDVFDTKAINLLNRAQWSGIASRLSRELNHTGAADELLMTAARMERLFHELETGRALQPGGEFEGVVGPRQYLARLYIWTFRAGALNPLRIQDEERATEYLLDLADAARKPYHEFNATGKLPEGLPDSIPRTALISANWISAHRMVVDYQARTDTNVRMMLLSLLLREYREQTGKFPAALQDLATIEHTLPIPPISEINIDPFSGNPFLYNLYDDNCELSSTCQQWDLRLRIIP